MDGADETIRLSLDASGVQQGATKANQALDATGKAAARLGQTIDATARDIYEFADSYEALGQKAEAATKPIGQGAKGAKDMIRGLVDESHKAADAAGKLGQASGNTAFAVTNVARAAQDFAFGGLPAISNNIEQLIPALGEIGKVGFAAFAGPAGIAAGLTMVATFAPQIGQAFGYVYSLFAGGATETEAQRMERLANATHRTAEEEKELVGWKEKRAAVEKLMAQGSAGEQAGAKHVSDAVALVGGAQAQKDLKAAIDKFDTQRFKDAGFGPDALAKAQAASQAKSGDLAAKILNQATSGKTEADRKAAQNAIGTYMAYEPFNQRSPLKQALQGGIVTDPAAAEKQQAARNQALLEQQQQQHQAYERQTGAARTAFNRMGNRNQAEAEAKAKRRHQLAEQYDAEQLRDFTQANPQLAPQVQAGLFRGGNTARAKDQAMAQLREYISSKGIAQGVDAAELAGRYVEEQSKGLQRRFDAAKNASGDVGRANLSVFGSIEQERQRVEAQYGPLAPLPPGQRPPAAAPPPEPDPNSDAAFDAAYARRRRITRPAASPLGRPPAAGGDAAEATAKADPALVGALNRNAAALEQANAKGVPIVPRRRGR
jgi:hypothetical protein